MKRVLSFVTLLLVTFSLLAGCGQATTTTTNAPTDANKPSASSTTPITLKAVSFLPTDHPLGAMIPEYAKTVETKTKGQVVIKLLGGPEVVPALEQVDTLRKGKIIDVAFNPASYYGPIIPQAPAMEASRLLPWEERQSGFFDAMVKYHKAANVMYLGRWLYSPFYIWLRNPVQKPEDLKGVKIRTQANQDQFLKNLGAVPVSVTQAETYVALERRMVDGFGWPVLGIRKDGWTEHAKYVIGNSFYDMQNCAILMNLDKWNSIPQDLQKQVQEATVEFEHKMVDYYKGEIDKEWKILKEQNGIKVIEFSPADAKKFVDTAYESKWQQIAQSVPNDVPELKKLSGN
ncbi:MAG: TRAP transporter substrate-binding protein DctP [Desulfitobacteriaceae bacterium]